MRYFKLQVTAIYGLAPTYAILFMDYLEDKILNSFAEKPLFGGAILMIFL